MTIQAEAIELYLNSVGVMIGSFMPLIGAIIGLFLAFAIANSSRFLIQRMVKKT